MTTINPLSPQFKNVPLDLVHIIERDTLPEITQMEVEGIPTQLGGVRHFKSNQYLSNRLPQQLSMAWTRLGPGEKLAAHFHPIASLIIVTKGKGRCFGDTELEIVEGDILFLPAWNLHGFEGFGPNGFEALSIQFEETAIFQDSENHQTTYQDREAIPLDQRKAYIAYRNDLDEISQITIDDQTHELGRVKNLSSDPFLQGQLPAFFSAAWVYLDTEQSLSPHTHEVDSLIVIANGDGQFQAGYNNPLETGDIVFVPAGQLHGFRGGSSGFWALSIQFEPVELYQDLTKQTVRFADSIQNLKQRNERRIKKLKQNPIFRIAKSRFQQKPELKKRLLSGLQVMSDNFQRLMFARMAVCEDENYRAVFLEHFLDELGHDQELKKERSKELKIWDPILEASTRWFLSKNATIDDNSRIVMVQMVLEKGASVFYSHFSQILSGTLKSHHIEKHSVADPEHENLGVDLLETVAPSQIKKLIEFQDQCFDMLELYLTQLAVLVKGSVNE